MNSGLCDQNEKICNLNGDLFIITSRPRIYTFIGNCKTRSHTQCIKYLKDSTSYDISVLKNMSLHKNSQFNNENFVLCNMNILRT